MISVLKITEGKNSVKHVDIVMVLILRITSHDALHFYQVS